MYCWSFRVFLLFVPFSFVRFQASQRKVCFSFFLDMDTDFLLLAFSPCVFLKLSALAVVTDNLFNNTPCFVLYSRCIVFLSMFCLSISLSARFSLVQPAFLGCRARIVPAISFLVRRKSYLFCFTYGIDHTRSVCLTSVRVPTFEYVLRDDFGVVQGYIQACVSILNEFVW